MSIRRDTLPHDITPYRTEAQKQTREQFIKTRNSPWLIYARSSLWDRALVLLRTKAEDGTAMVSFDIEGGGHAFLHPVRKRSDAADPGIFLGRTNDNDLMVPVASVSSRHGRFLPGKQWTYEDLQSSNGTWCDEKRLAREPVVLREGSLLRLGGNLLAYFVSPGRLYELLNNDAEMNKLIDA